MPPHRLCLECHTISSVSNAAPPPPSRTPPHLLRSSAQPLLQNQFNDGDEYEEVDEEEALGLSEEVLDFVLKISRRPELWTDFPLSLPDDTRIESDLSNKLRQWG
ncbi:hypothetical protein ACS0TY_024165 [Phlomoides rotata]